jgi:hypothetical protein
MDPLATLLKWLAPVLDPLADFRKQVEKLTAIHQSSVHTFSALAGSLIQYYYHESLTNHNVILKDFSVPIANGETDIILKENGIEKWVEVKNILNLRRRTGSWPSLGDQIDRMVDNGARNIVIDLPQGITNNMKQELINRGAARHVSVEVRTPSGIPYEPPVPPNWGNSLPNP